MRFRDDRAGIDDSGYGSTGPYARAPGYDVVIEAEAGLMHITGEKSGRPVKVRSRNCQASER